MVEKATREITATDLEAVDKAVTANELLCRHLYTIRGILGELGKLEKRHRDIKNGIGNGEHYRDGLSEQIETVKAELAKLQKEFAEKQREIVKLDAEIETKYRTLEGYSKAIDRITGAAA